MLFHNAKDKLITLTLKVRALSVYLFACLIANVLRRFHAITQSASFTSIHYLDCTLYECF